MTKVLVLDESGTIDSDCKTENFFVFGGILYDLDQLEAIKTKLLPAFLNYKKILGVRELKSTKLTSSKNIHNLVYGAILGLINYMDELKPILYILVKSKSSLILSYDKKSFKYNKLLEFLVNDIIEEKLLSKNDKLIILLDDIDLCETEIDNLRTWLPSNVPQVIKVETAKSEDFVFIQIADLIAGIPKLKGTTPKQIKADHKLKMLSNCYVHVFPKSQACNITAETSE